MLKDPTPPRLPPENIKGLQPVRLLDKVTVDKYVEHIFRNGTFCNFPRYRSGPLKAMLDLPAVFDKVKPFM